MGQISIDFFRTTYFCTTDHLQNFDEPWFLQIGNREEELVAGIPFRMQSVIPLVGRFFKFCRTDSSVIVNQAFNEGDIFSLKKLAFLSLVKYLLKSKDPRKRQEDLLKAIHCIEKEIVNLQERTNDV